MFYDLIFIFDFVNIGCNFPRINFLSQNFHFDRIHFPRQGEIEKFGKG